MGPEQRSHLQALRMPGDRRRLGRLRARRAAHHFRRAVAARPGEKIVCAWQIWPDRDSFYASEARMHEDDALAVTGEIPFDPARLIYGCFQPLHTMGR
tara:strand:- start:507 stop:800 length:294 start_codon:yes stop_codon:yes gene_type:complete